MVPECRHVLSNGDRCGAVAMRESHWCYFHARLHDQNAQRLAREAERRRRQARSQLRLGDGTFAPCEATQTFDQGYPVISEAESGVTAPAVELAEAVESVSLRLPDAEDSASIQLALIEVLHALAANQLDPRRAGLLLYGLQVGSANAKGVHFHSRGVRGISYTEDGIPLAS